jgi:GTP1/Obg family GTP-binding protein
MVSWPISGTQLSRLKRYVGNCTLTLISTTPGGMMTDEEKMEAMVEQFHKELQPYVDEVNKYTAMLADIREAIGIIENITEEADVLR